MPDTFDRLKAALADRYAIEHELGSGGMAMVAVPGRRRLHRRATSGATKVMHMKGNAAEYTAGLHTDVSLLPTLL